VACRGPGGRTVAGWTGVGVGAGRHGAVGWLHRLEPRVDPVRRTISEYALGEHAWCSTRARAGRGDRLGRHAGIAGPRWDDPAGSYPSVAWPCVWRRHSRRGRVPEAQLGPRPEHVRRPAPDAEPGRVPRLPAGRPGDRLGPGGAGRGRARADDPRAWRALALRVPADSGGRRHRRSTNARWWTVIPLGAVERTSPSPRPSPLPPSRIPVGLGRSARPRTPSGRPGSRRVQAEAGLIPSLDEFVVGVVV
jgi:hypothetical protein